MAALQGVGICLADHVAGDIDRSVAAIATEERVASINQTDDAGFATSDTDITDLESKVARAAVDQHDLARQRAGREGCAAVQVATRAVTVLHRGGDDRCRVG